MFSILSIEHVSCNLLTKNNWIVLINDAIQIGSKILKILLSIISYHINLSKHIMEVSAQSNSNTNME